MGRDREVLFLSQEGPEAGCRIPTEAMEGKTWRSRAKALEGVDALMGATIISHRSL